MQTELLIETYGKLQKEPHVTPERISEPKRNRQFVTKIISQSPVFGKTRSQEEMQTTLRKRLGKQNHAEKIFILEEMAQTANTIVKIKEALRNLGYQNVLAGSLFIGAHSNCVRELDFHGPEIYPPESESPLKALYRIRSDYLTLPLMNRDWRLDPRHPMQTPDIIKTVESTKEDLAQLKQQRNKIRRLLTNAKR